MRPPIEIKWNEETLIAFIRGKKIAYVYDNMTIEIYPPNYSENDKLNRAFQDGIEAQRMNQRMIDIVFDKKSKKKK